MTYNEFANKHEKWMRSYPCPGYDLNGYTVYEPPQQHGALRVCKQGTCQHVTFPRGCSLERVYEHIFGEVTV
jgi:hypothetical protein